ncbi:MAG: flagellar export protein FliJ [Acetobacteraceae bacterium]|nr:flagellar export protein FliJ [Acetobacteraceae bacterium]
MSGLATLRKLTERRAAGALASWQSLRTQCDEAKQKLSLLKKHAQGYRDVMHAGLEQGMSAASMMAHIAFIGQIEAVVVRQEAELGSLEEACGRQWQELLDARREQRMCEILSERTAVRDAEAASRREQAEVDELLQRAAMP